jgi:hypothetical protein
MVDLVLMLSTIPSFVILSWEHFKPCLAFSGAGTLNAKPRSTWKLQTFASPIATGGLLYKSNNNRGDFAEVKKQLKEHCITPILSEGWRHRPVCSEHALSAGIRYGDGRITGQIFSVPETYERFLCVVPAYRPHEALVCSPDYLSPSSSSVQLNFPISYGSNRKWCRRVAKVRREEDLF